jgi:hypothetical protein
MDTAFKTARIEAIVALGEMGAAQDIISRTPVLSQNNVLKANMQLRAGNDAGACAVADTVLEGRGAPKWARLRAYCHVVRDEIAAAELTTDVLRSSGYDDPTYFNLMNRIMGGSGKPDFKSLSADDPLHMALMSRAGMNWPKARPQTAAARMALSALAAPEDRLVALYAAGEALSDAQIREILTSLTVGGEDMVGAAAPNYDAAMAADVPLGTAQLFEIAQTGAQADRPRAVAEFLKRAKGAGAFDRFMPIMAPSIQNFSPEEQVMTDLKLFVRAAINQQDVTALRGIYGALRDKPETQERIALISDALGYGFLGGDLGIDLETRLAGDGAVKTRAERDVFIALAMGARLSDIAEAKFMSAGVGSGKAPASGALAALDASARSGAKAETALRAAGVLAIGSLDNPSLYAVIKALSEAGLTKFAGRVAAEDFLQDLPV